MDPQYLRQTSAPKIFKMKEEKKKGMFKTKLFDGKWTCQLGPTPLIFLAIAIFDTLLSELNSFKIYYCNCSFAGTLHCRTLCSRLPFSLPRNNQRRIF